MKIIKYILAASLAFGFCSSTFAQFGKLGKFIPGAAPAQADPNADTPKFGAEGASVPSVSIEDMKAQLDQSILSIGLARKSFLEAQWLLSGALGFKEEADKMLSGAGVLQDGKIAQPSTQDEIAEACNVSRDLNEKIKESLSGTVTLNEQQKKYYIAAKKRYAVGFLEEGGQIAVLAVLVKQMKDQTDQFKGNAFNPANVGPAAKLAAMAVPAGKLFSLLPGDLKEMYSFWPLFRKVGADNNIEVEDVDIEQFLSGASSGE